MASSFFFDKTKTKIFETFTAIFRGGEGGQNRLSKYGWYNVLYMASEGDLQKMKELERMPVYDVMNLINYKIDYQKEHFQKNNVKK